MGGQGYSLPFARLPFLSHACGYMSTSDPETWFSFKPRSLVKRSEPQPKGHARKNAAGYVYKGAELKEDGQDGFAR